jgi:hypothetical protein
MALTQTAQKTSQMAPRLVASVRVFCSPLEGAPTWCVRLRRGHAGCSPQQRS